LIKYPLPNVFFHFRLASTLAANHQGCQQNMTVPDIRACTFKVNKTYKFMLPNGENQKFVGEIRRKNFNVIATKNVN